MKRQQRNIVFRALSQVVECVGYFSKISFSRTRERQSPPTSHTVRLYRSTQGNWSGFHTTFMEVRPTVTFGLSVKVESSSGTVEKLPSVLSVELSG